MFSLNEILCRVLNNLINYLSFLFLFSTSVNATKNEVFTAHISAKYLKFVFAKYLKLMLNKIANNYHIIVGKNWTDYPPEKRVVFIA